MVLLQYEIICPTDVYTRSWQQQCGLVWNEYKEDEVNSLNAKRQSMNDLKTRLRIKKKNLVSFQHYFKYKILRENSSTTDYLLIN